MMLSLPEVNLQPPPRCLNMSFTNFQFVSGLQNSNLNSTSQNKNGLDREHETQKLKDALTDKENIIHELEKDLVRANAKLDNWEDKLKTAVAEKANEIEKEYRNATQAAFLEGMTTANKNMSMYSSMLSNR